MRLIFLFLFLSCFVFGQKSRHDLAVSKIDSTLVRGVDAVIRDYNLRYEVQSFDKIILNTERITTIFNEQGIYDASIGEFYSQNSKVKDIELQVFDALGNLMKTYKRKDFKDEAAVDGVTLYSDSRKLILDFKPTSYPVTCRYTSVMEESSTAFIAPFMPLEGYKVSIEKASISFRMAAGLKLNHTSNALAQKLLNKSESDQELSLTCGALGVVTYEYLGEPFIDRVPFVRFSLDKFSLEGVSGAATDWNSWGKWYYQTLLKGTDELPEATKAKIQSLTQNAKSTREKAAIVYNFVKEKVRYISVQVGIGGFKPMLASDVDRLSYGDCKALTNYTRALLKAAGVPSYFTVIYGDYDKRNIDKNFVSLQGNHAILAIPENNDYIWVECTSQDLPFGFAGTFTADRDALVIKDEQGGEIVHTKIFTAEQNVQDFSATIQMATDGGMKAQIKIENQGVHFDNSYLKAKYDAKKRDAHYKEMFSMINNLQLQSVKFKLDTLQPKFTEEVDLSAEQFIETMGEYKTIQPLALMPLTYIPKRLRNRSSRLVVDEPKIQRTEVKLLLSDNQNIDVVPENYQIDSDFGTYTLSFEKRDNKTCVVTRKLALKSGKFPSSAYEKYRKFLEQVSRADQNKIILKVH
ncbi:DUF3857 domain-containing protein [Flavobacterium aurantiibacter]|uniref:DUF3857 domain-containing protein n=1 Tax=Flavobacterium aurantiibacter TaxID=2023067 RepID=UPI000D528AEB|nr:DUF3857 domain-containing protein [Flavobacterium aurantiibacter]